MAPARRSSLPPAVVVVHGDAARAATLAGELGHGGARVAVWIGHDDDPALEEFRTEVGGRRDG